MCAIRENIEGVFILAKFHDSRHDALRHQICFGAHQHLVHHSWCILVNLLTRHGVNTKTHGLSENKVLKAKHIICHMFPHSVPHIEMPNIPFQNCMTPLFPVICDPGKFPLRVLHPLPHVSEGFPVLGHDWTFHIWIPPDSLWNCCGYYFVYFVQSCTKNNDFGIDPGEQCYIVLHSAA